jgi:alpha-galactosidase
MLTALCREMEELCPRAVLLNYSNPMSMNMQTIFRTSGVRAIGLCHSVQGTFDQLMGYIGEDPAGVGFVCAGINHMAFYLRIEKDGVDLYPRLFEAMERPDAYDSNKVRFELMKRLGYFVTESSEHNAEYSPFFIPHGRETIARFNVPIDEYLRRCETSADEFDRLKALSRSDAPLDVRRSHEYGSTIIRSMVTGAPSVVYGNVVNEGSISNLPRSAVVEVATVVDRTGIRPTTVGELPPQLVAYVQPHAAQAELFIRAAAEGRRDHVYQAAMFDPLTAAILPPDRIVEMCDELIAAHGFVEQGGSLPKLDASPRRVSGGTANPVAKLEPGSLRASWDTAKSANGDRYIEAWYVIGPFRSPHEGVISVEMKTLLEDEFVRRADGAVDLKATYGWGDSTIRWQKVMASPRNGVVNLSAEIGPYEWAVAYGYAEVESAEARQAVMRCGSDDGIRVWLNGQMVHTNESRRPYRPADDTVTVQLKAGVNRILVKVDNARFAWGFGVSIDASR